MADETQSGARSSSRSRRRDAAVAIALLILLAGAMVMTVRSAFVDEPSAGPDGAQEPGKKKQGGDGAVDADFEVVN